MEKLLVIQEINVVMITPLGIQIYLHVNRTLNYMKIVFKLTIQDFVYNVKTLTI